MSDFNSFLERSVADYTDMRHHKREAYSVSVKGGKVDRLSNGLCNGVEVIAYCT